MKILLKSDYCTHTVYAVIIYGRDFEVAITHSVSVRPRGACCGRTKTTCMCAIHMHIHIHIAVGDMPPARLASTSTLLSHENLGNLMRGQPGGPPLLVVGCHGNATRELDAVHVHVDAEE